MAQTISERIAHFVEQTGPEKLSADVTEMVQLCLLDWLGSAIAGANTRPIEIFRDVAKDLGGEPQATVIPDGSKTSCHLAALVNAASSHALEMDDLHKPSVLHPAAPVIPAALSAAERDGTSGSELAAAIVIGYEVAIRAGEAVGPSHYHFWHTTGTCGVFGAAAAAGRLLRLTPPQMVWALGSAGTQSAGLWEFLKEGAMSKQLHPAKAAADGLLAALLAQKGFTGASMIFEGEKGLGQATSESAELSRLTEGLGNDPPRILENSFKAHAACYHIHSTIDAVLALKRRCQITPDRVRKVRVRLYSAALDLLDKVEPVNAYASKFSVPYCVATAFLHGRVGLENFDEEAVREPGAKRLMSKVTLEPDKELDRLYPEKWPAIVTVETVSGKRHETRVDYPKGDPKNPMSRDELIEKFHSLTGSILPLSVRGELVKKCLRLEKLGNARELLSDFAPGLPLETVAAEVTAHPSP